MKENISGQATRKLSFEIYIFEIFCLWGVLVFNSVGSDNKHNKIKIKEYSPAIAFQPQVHKCCFICYEYK